MLAKLVVNRAGSGPILFAAGANHYRLLGLEVTRSTGVGKVTALAAPASGATSKIIPIDETFREYERVVDPKYLDEIRALAKQFSTKSLSRQARLAEDTIRKFKNGKNTIRPRSLRKLIKAIHALQNKKVIN